MPRVAFLLCDQLLATSLTLPQEMLHAAQMAARRQRLSAPALHITLVGLDAQPVTSSAGLTIAPQANLTQCGPVDLVFVPALWRNPRPILRRYQAYLPWLRERYAEGAILCGGGTGCCFLAEAGLLDGKPATTHWFYFDQFQQDYPQVDLKRKYFITKAEQLYCAGSINALADLTVHFIQHFFGKAIASHVQRHFSHEIRQPIEASSYLDTDPTRHPDEDVIQAQLWLHEHFAKPINLAQVARHFDMSVRTFNRRFKQATGKTPVQYLQEVRMEAAKELLKSSNLGLAEIADQVGYQDSGYFSALFKRLMATSPSDYRTTVRGKLFSVNH